VSVVHILLENVNGVVDGFQQLFDQLYGVGGVLSNQHVVHPCALEVAGSLIFEERQVVFLVNAQSLQV